MKSLVKVSGFKSLFLLCFLSVLSFKGVSQIPSSCEQALMITKSAEKFHYAPRPVDDKFSELVFDDFISSLDENGYVFNSTDIQQFKKYYTQIDDEILTQKCHFLDEVSKLYYKRLMQSDSIVNSFRKKKIDLDKDEKITFSKELVYPANSMMVDKWQKRIKLQILYASFSESDSSTNFVKPTATKIAEIQNKVIERQSCRLKSKLNFRGGIKNFVGEKFLGAVARAFDPHTTYLSKEEMDQFKIALSKETNTFGFEIEENESNEIEIFKIVPGSSAWNSNKLNEGDIILGVKIPQAEYKEFACMSIREVIQYFSSDKIKEGTFHVKKSNGQEIQVTLFKEKIEVEDNVIESFILEGDHKVGYIYLPSFYSQELEFATKGCANDVAREIINLKKENIEALIIDLRDNGGGYMHEAINLAGIFVDYGAISIIDSKGQGPVTLKDMNRGTLFSAPLVVMVNHSSASASELFAAAMQDMNRGVIVGATTFGKASSQTVIPLEAYKSTNPVIAKESDLAYLKITEGKFYRVTGQSHQKKGIIPDIQLPDLYDEIEYSENMFPSALETQTIDKKTYYFPSAPLPLAKLRTQSEERVKKNTAFTEIKNKSHKLVERQKNYTIPLKYDLFKANYEKMLKEEDEELDVDSVNYKVSNPEYLKGISDMSDSESEINSLNMESINTDLYIQEVYNIIKDLVENQNK